MGNYFNTLSLRDKLSQLGVCKFMDNSEFTDGINALKGKKIVIVGCGGFCGVLTEPLLDCWRKLSQRDSGH